jgi:hypothetical protein
LAENGCYLVWSFENKYHALSVQVGLCHWSFFHDLLWKEEICPASESEEGCPFQQTNPTAFYCLENCLPITSLFPSEMHVH